MKTTYNFDRDSHRKNVDFTRYYWFHSGFSVEELKKIEKMTEKLPFVDATINGKELNPEKRKSKIKWCPQNDEWRWVYEKLHNLIVEANSEMWKFDLTHMTERIQYTEYYEEGGHYGWHMDIGKNDNAGRKISVTVQLSDPEEYEGGDLEMNIGNILEIPRKQGATIIFPSFYLHRVTPITKGTRKSFVLWVGGEPYR